MVNVSCSSPLSGTLERGESESDRLIIFVDSHCSITRIVDCFRRAGTFFFFSARERHRFGAWVGGRRRSSVSTRKRAGTWERAMTTPLPVPRGVLKEATGLSAGHGRSEPQGGSQIYHKAPASKRAFYSILFIHKTYTANKNGTCSANEV